MLGGACELQDFQKRILQLAPELIKQLFDLRSQIPKEAANVICLLARKNYQNMKKITEILISKTALLKVNMTIQNNTFSGHFKRYSGNC